MSTKLSYQRLYKDGLDYPFGRALDVDSLDLLKVETTDVSDGSLRVVPGAGIYRYDPSSTLTADDFSVLAPDTLPGRWILIGPGGDGAGMLNVATYADLQDVRPYPWMTRGVLGHAAIGDGGFGVFMWHDGDTTAADGQYVLESTRVGFRPGESGEGRWHKVVSQVGVIADYADIERVHPGIYDFLLLDLDSWPGILRWKTGSGAAANGKTVFASIVADYAIGDVNEGRWELVLPYAEKITSIVGAGNHSIAHALGYTPTFVVVQPQSAGNAYLTSDPDAGDVYVTTDAGMTLQIYVR